MNKHIHRVVFNKTRGQFIAVSEVALSSGKGSQGSTDCGGAGDSAGSAGGGAQRLQIVALAAAVLCGGALAGPLGGAVVGGSASISGGGASPLTTIQQNSNRAIINWQSFGINAGQTVKINQPGVNAALLNRVTGSLPSRIDGSLLANGQVFLVNPNGIVVGANGVVNVNGGFVASTQNTDDAGFMSGGAMQFSGAHDAAIQVLGTIESASGPITLIAPKVNVATGSVLTSGAAINLIAASSVSLSNGQFTVTPQAGDAGQITMAGALKAAEVQLAAVNNNLGALAINTTGTIRATGVQNNPDGSIRIVATGQGRVELTDAKLSAVNADGTGGKIDVTGNHTGLFGTTVLDASGTTQGGSVRVGGGFQGQEADIANGQATFVGTDVQLKADATTQGDGGRVVVWADGSTRYNGALSARGAGTGKGGDAEVSGKGTLAFNGTADLRGGAQTTEANGTLLLDPSDITISNAADGSATIAAGSPGVYNPTSATSNLNISTLKTALTTADVTVKTSGGTGGSGDITIVDAFDFANSTRNATLRLEADRNIAVNGVLTDTGTGYTFLSLRAVQDIGINAAITVKGSVYAIAGRDININSQVQGTGNGYMVINSAALNPLTAADLALGNGWQTGTGVIRFGAGGSVGTNAITYLQSGKDAGGARTNFTTSTNSTLANDQMYMYGFDTVNLNANRSGTATLVEARNINVSASILGDSYTTLHAAGYDASNNYIGTSGWRNGVGQINFTDPNIAFTGTQTLDLGSGLAASGLAIDNRHDLPGTVQLVGGTGARNELIVQGFRDVTLSQAITATGGGGINIVGRNIQVDKNLTSNGYYLRLRAGSYDTGALVPNSYTDGGWGSQPGLLRFSSPGTTTLTVGYNLDFSSGVDYAGNTFSPNGLAATSAGSTARVDLPTSLTFVKRAVDLMPGDVGLGGFRDVTLPFSSISGSYGVFARNITVPASFAGVYTGGQMNLQAASYVDQTASPSFPTPAGTLVSTAAGSYNDAGTIIRDGDLALDLRASHISIQSGLGTSAGPAMRTNLNLGAITDVDGGGGGKFVHIAGFDTVTTKAGIPITRLGFDSSYDGQFSLSASSIVIRSDINAHWVQLSAGGYNNTTRIGDGNTDVNNGTLTFENNPVLRSTPDPGGGGGIGLSTGRNGGALSSTGPGGVTFGYANSTVNKISTFGIDGFNGTEVLMENGQSLNLELAAYLTQNGYRPFSIRQRVDAIGDVVLLNNLNSNGNTLLGYTDGGIDAGGGGIRTGNYTITTPNAFYLYAGKDSAVNMAGNQVRVVSRGAGTTLVVNEKDNISVLDGDPNGAGNIEINARGEIDLPTNWSRTNGASLTFKADAKYGRTLAPVGGFATTDLNTIHTNTGVFGETGGDGLGAVTLRSVGPILVTPVFRLVYVVEADTTAPANLYTLAGVAVPAGTALLRGQQYAYPRDAGLPNNNFDSVTSNGTPLRNTLTIAVGGFTVPAGAALTYYDTSNVAFAAGTFLPSGTQVLTKGVYNGNWASSGAQTYVIGGYQTSASSSVPIYTSLGTSFTTTHSTIGGSGTAGALAGDAPVDASVAANYYGNPVTGNNTTLNLSGQFYTLDALGGTQVAPTKVNLLAGGTGNNSTSTNGWDIGFTTGTLSTNTGDLWIYSGAAHATDGVGHMHGDAADLSIFNNPAPANFGYTTPVRDGAVQLSTGTGNLVVLGYRDMTVEAGGTLAAGGNVTIGAARDLTINAAVPADNAGKLTTLIAGNMIKSTQTIGTAGTGNLMLVAGGGVDVATNVAVLSGSLQDSTTRTGVLAGGLTPTGTFKVTNTGALTVGGLQTNNEVNDVTFDGTTGIVYAASGLLARSGVVSQSVNGTAGFGAIDIAATGSSGNITVAQDVRAQQAGANVSLTADAGIAQTNTAARVAADTINLRALGGSIGGAGAAVLVSAATAASSTVPQVNFTQTGTAGSGVTIQGDAETNFSGSTTAGNAGIALSTVAGTLRVKDNSAAIGAGFNGVNANGSGAISLTAGGATSDVDSAAQTRSGLGTITVIAGRNILDNMVGELVSGSDTTASTALNFVTGGALSLNAGNTIGGDGTTGHNALEVAYGGGLNSSSAGTGNVSGTYLNILDTTGSVDIATSSVTVTSAKNVDLTSRASTTASSGNLALQDGGVTSGNNGYIRLAADRNVSLSGITAANGSGNVVVSAGNDITQAPIDFPGSASITSGTGEVNLYAGNNIFLAADATTGGNVLAQAAGGAITSLGGVLTSTGAAGVVSLKAGTTLGTSANRIGTNAANTVLQSAGSQFVTSSGATTLAAATTANGAIDVLTTDGSLTVGNVGVNSILTPTTGLITTAANGAPTTVQGVTANGSGAVTLAANGAASDLVSAATTRSGTGTVTVSGRNVIDSLAGELGSGTDTTASAKLNFVTGGALALNASDSVGSASNALEVAYGTTLTSNSAGTGTTSGTYLNMLDTAGSAGVSQPSLAVTSAKNVDLTSRASTTAGTGDLTVGAAGITSDNSGYIRVAADRNVTLAGAISATTTGNVVVAAGLNAVTGGSITQLAAGTITSTGGEVNLRAANDIVQGANITTFGNVLAQAATGAITSTGGVWKSVDGEMSAISLQAATTIGTSGSRIGTDAAVTVLQSAGNQFVTSSGPTTLAAATTANGAIDVRTTNGSLTVGDVGVGSSLGALNGGSTTVANGAPTGLRGVSAQGSGAVTLAANGPSGDIFLNRNVTSGSGAVNLTASRNVRFAQNNAQAATSSTVTVTAANDIVNATGQTSGVGSVDQIVASASVLNAGRHIGSGVIDNTLTSVNNANDLNVNVASLTTNAGVTAATGDAVLWNRGAVNLVGANSAKGYFGINAGGLIQQTGGSTLAATSAEFDTMRNTGIGRVTLVNTGDLKLGNAGASTSGSVVGGDLSVTSTAGSARVNAGYTVSVNGDASFNGATGVQILGSVRQGGNVVQNGVVTNAGGAAVAEVVITGANAVVTAHGNSAVYLLTPAVVAQLSAAGVTSVTIDLGNTVTTFPVGTSLAGNAILLGGTNTVSGNWTVRTGSATNAPPTSTTRQYNLTDGASALNLGAMNLTINAAKGTAFAAGTQASTVLAEANDMNTAAGFNAANGSSVTLNHTQTSGVQSVRDAYDVAINSPGTVNAGYVHANRDLMLVAGSQAGKNLNTSGALSAGRNLIGVAGMDVNLNAGTSLSAANGRVTLVADETAGAVAGAGRFTNNVAGLNILAGAENDVAIYAVAGGSAPTGYNPVASQMLLNGLQVNGVALSETQPASNWSNAYQVHAGGSTNWRGYAADGAQYVAGAGKFGSPEVWYKTLLTVVTPPVPAPPAPSVAQTPPSYAGECLTKGMHTGRFLPHQYGDVSYFANTSYLRTAGNDYREIQEELRDSECNSPAAYLPYLPTVYRPEAPRTLAMATAPAMGPVVAPVLPALQAAVQAPSAAARQPHRVTISADGLFAFDKSGLKDLLPEGRAKVERLAREINKSFVNVTQVLVIGHTDRLGGNTYNLELSRKRAETVRALLVSSGLDTGLIRTAGKGATEPLVECPAQASPQALRDCLQPNRRVNVDVLGDAAN